MSKKKNNQKQSYENILRFEVGIFELTQLPQLINLQRQILEQFVFRLFLIAFEADKALPQDKGKISLRWTIRKHALTQFIWK
jgi:hypothetical protein